MSQWFRMYAAMRNDPKVQRLPCEVFKAWVNLLCLAAERDGALPSIEDIAFDLRLPEGKARKIIATLTDAGLLDVTDNGMEPHNWRSRQYKSDVSTERVKRFRKRAKAASETPPDTETEQKEEERETRARARDPAPLRTAIPPDFWPAPEVLMWAALQKITDAELAKHVETFIAHYRHTGELSADWNAAFKKWLIRSPQFDRERPGGWKTGGDRPRPGSPLDAASRVIARRQGAAGL